MGGNNLSLTIKKQLVCKPGSVPHKSEVPVIYLSLLSPTGFIGPPSGIGRAALIAPVYMTFQLPRSTAFSSALLNPHGLLPVKKWNALCCPDFPPASRRCTRQANQLFLGAKLQQLVELTKLWSLKRLFLPGGMQRDGEHKGCSVTSLLPLYCLSVGMRPLLLQAPHIVA